MNIDISGQFHVEVLSDVSASYKQHIPVKPAEDQAAILRSPMPG